MDDLLTVTAAWVMAAVLTCVDVVHRVWTQNCGRRIAGATGVRTARALHLPFTRAVHGTVGGSG